ncbi:MAG: hypothetical protein MUE50_08510 [Pirellulaceae bacterium]|nr:hypothetical protein [Pirellulaceae bacterium]
MAQILLVEIVGAGLLRDGPSWSVTLSLAVVGSRRQSATRIDGWLCAGGARDAILINGGSTMQNRRSRMIRTAALALGLGFMGMAYAAIPVQIDPDGPGPMDAQATGSIDWQVGNMLVPDGIAKLQVGDRVRALLQARLNLLLDANNVPLPFPADKEWTYVASVPLKVTSMSVDANGKRTIQWEFDGNAAPSSPDYSNFMEIWADDNRNSNDLQGTGFNDGKLILMGLVTNVGQFVTISQPQVLFDQFLGDSYSGQQTLTINGSQSIVVNVVYPDADYFPDFDLTKVESIISWFNSSNITPFKQANPSARFVGDASGTAPNVLPSIGTVNGSSGPDVQAQADPNQSFEYATEVIPGACRVTYGGNDRNGNVDPRKFAEACYKDTTVKGRKGAGTDNCYTFGGQAGAPSATSAKGGPFGEHTHHQMYGPAGDFVFRAGTNSAPKNTRIEEITCKDEGACRQAAANGNFKQIDFDGTGSFRVLDATAKAYLIARGAPADIDTDNVSDRKYYFRVDMDDLGEPGNQWASGKKNVVSDLLQRCQSFFSSDQNNALATADPLFMSFFGGYTQVQACSSCPDVYQIRIYSGDSRENPGSLMYEVRGFLTGGNIQIHRLIR